MVRDVSADFYSSIFILVLLNNHTSSEVFPGGGGGGAGEATHSKTQEFTPSLLQS